MLHFQLLVHVKRSSSKSFPSQEKVPGPGPAAIPAAVTGPRCHRVSSSLCSTCPALLLPLLQELRHWANESFLILASRAALRFPRAAPHHSGNDIPVSALPTTLLQEGQTIMQQRFTEPSLCLSGPGTVH